MNESAPVIIIIIIPPHPPDGRFVVFIFVCCAVTANRHEALELDSGSNPCSSHWGPRS